MCVFLAIPFIIYYSIFIFLPVRKSTTSCGMRVLNEIKNFFSMGTIATLTLTSQATLCGTVIWYHTIGPPTTLEPDLIYGDQQSIRTRPWETHHQLHSYSPHHVVPSPTTNPILRLWRILLRLHQTRTDLEVRPNLHSIISRN